MILYTLLQWIMNSLTEFLEKTVDAYIFIRL
ncbi:hypothetical protein FB6_4709 [Serratia marcescens]|nr:hypothetical protein SME36J_34810 [Serratia marcescens]BEN16250.1 hypothetical protein SMKC004_20450 [Serratia marcescens]CAB1227796.1 hypothetical protein FB6_4709 [Serratia marcescens]